MKITKCLTIPLISVLGLSLTTNHIMDVQAEGNQNNYFEVDITYPEKQVKRYKSYEYSTAPIDLSSMKASKKKVKIKLIKVVKNNQEQDLSNMQISYDYMTKGKHVNSLEAKGKTISLPLNFLKASSYSDTDSSSSGKIAIRDKNESPLEAVSSYNILPFKDTKYNKSVDSTISLAYLRNGLYGSKSKGLQLKKNDTLVNNVSLSNHPYSWWTSEYKYINKQWRASTFLLSINYPFNQDSNDSHTAYKFKIQRSSKGYIKSIKLEDTLAYVESSKYGEVWESTSLDNRDEYMDDLTNNWEIGDTFKYKYLLIKPTIKKNTVSNQSVTITWKKRTDCDGFEIEYSKKKNFKNTSKYKINNYTATSATLNSLSKNSKYYIRMRSFGIVEGKKYYSSYSKTKVISTKSH